MPNLLYAKFLFVQDFPIFRIGKNKADIVAKWFFQTCCFGIEYTNFHIKFSLSRFIEFSFSLDYILIIAQYYKKVNTFFQKILEKLDQLRLTRQKEKVGYSPLFSCSCLALSFAIVSLFFRSASIFLALACSCFALISAFLCKDI